MTYLAFCLAGLALGFWPGAVYSSSRVDIPSAPLPALQCVCVAQAAFILLAHPILLAGRRAFGLLPAAVESLMCLAAAGPFYFVAAWLGDGTAIDALRAAAYVAMLWPLGWAGAACIVRGFAGPTLLALLVICLGLPAGWYVCVEFLPGLNAGWLWNLAPLTNAWTQAASHVAACWPVPVWAALAWPALAAAAGLALMMFTKQ